MKRILLLVFFMLILLTGKTWAWFGFSLTEPIHQLADNSAVDIIYDGTYVWLATGNGLSGTSDGGESWRTYDETNAFTHSSISALVADQGRIWVATAYTIQTDVEEVDVGGGLQITDDFGENWHLVDSSQFSTPAMLSYDMAVLDSTVWAACYYGGLVKSLDYGESWENIFINDEVRDDYEQGKFKLYAGRYFSVIIDPYHDDSTIVWAGSAEGIQRIYYIAKRKELAGNQVNDISYDGRYWWYATNRGLSRVFDSLFTFNSYDSSNGFPGNNISAVGSEDDLICAGIYDTLTEQSLGFVMSTDGGASWETKAPPGAIGQGRFIEEIEVSEGAIWAACNDGGLIKSTNQGVSWESFYFDSTVTDLTDSRNIFHCIDISPRDGFTKILAGTDSGIVIFYFTDPEVLDSTSYMELFDTAIWGQKIISVTSMVTEFGEETWAASHPQRNDFGDSYATIRYVEGDLFWKPHLVGPPAVIPYDVEISEAFGDTAIWVATDQSPYRSGNFGEKWERAPVRDAITGELIPLGEPFLALEIDSNQVHCGMLTLGAASLNNAASLWLIHRAQTNPDNFDFVGRSIAPSTEIPPDTVLGGNHIPALGLQRTGDSTIIWAAHRQTSNKQRIGVSITTNRGRIWKEVLSDVQAWNFDFNGDSVFVAASEGLYLSTDIGQNWKTFTLNDPVSGRSIAPGVWILSVRIVDGMIWVGTEDGIARSSDGIGWQIIRTFANIDSTAEADQRSYVSPNPFSAHVYEAAMKFHYRLEHGGDVTIKIYDFANNLVKVVVDGVPRDAGEQYDDLDLWDGYNENGDLVAGGVYFYLIESSGGDQLWGKFMVIP